MGRIIQKNNGLTTIFTTGEDISTITPSTNTYFLGVDSNTGLYEKLNPDGVTVDLEKDSSGITGGTLSGTTLVLDNSGGGNINISLSGLSTGGGVISTTYLNLVNDITGNTLSVGSYYIINDFKTCYDQPDFDYDGNPITTGNYKEGPIEPILVLATSGNTISSIAYQPSYPNDKILYDWTFNQTEVTNGVSYGRITERIDEFNNRTDYDHRNISFKRYKLFTYREQLRVNGTIELLSDGTVNGTDTAFTGLTVGNVIYIPNSFPSYYEIVGISGDTLMSVSGDTIGSTGPGESFYSTIEETNDSTGYFSYKRTNVKTDDYLEYTTFGNALLINYAKNNYIGNHANNYQNEGNDFLLSNNVFLEGQYESNKFGDYCYNNTWGTDNENNTWGDFCYNNVSTNDIDRCIFGNYFYNNLINVNLNRNRIGNDFKDNKLLSENDEDFRENVIGDNFYSNVIYSEFYDNTINVDFNNNIIGDYGNLTELRFYRNQIGNYFNGNLIRQDFQNNIINTNFQSNTINGEFKGNEILNGFNNNTIGSYFNINVIGNGFNNNNIYDSFYENKTSYYFYGNIISNDFYGNDIGNFFENNKPSNYSLFGWYDLTTVSTRTYDTFLNSLNGGGLGNKILGKELVMRVISTSQYFIIKFTQWTQDGNGGGIQYERTEIDSSGNPLSSTITFTKINYGNEVDIVVPGVLEITRGNNQGIYNIITESSWNGNGPSDTEWNSIYTEPNNGRNFAYNKIGNNFYNNIISNDFGYGGSSAQGNVINDNFQNNLIGSFMYNNVIGNFFTNNTIGDDFEDNQIQNFFIGNTIGTGFTSNQIGNYFGNNASAPNTPVQNTIFNDFKYNKIGNFFGNDTNFLSIGTGTNGDGGNVINDGFQYNQIGDNFIFNLIDLSFTNNKIGNDFWFNVFGLNTTDNVIGNLFVGNGGVGGFPNPIGDGFSSNKLGNYSGFNIIGADFKNNEIGDFFGNTDVPNIIANNFNNNKIGNYFGDDGNHIDGGNTITNAFYNNLIGNKFYGNTIDPLFHSNDIGNEFYSNIIQDNPGDGEFQDNEIGNGFNGNTTSGWFDNNQIANDFNGNTNIGDFFESNIIGNSFNSNPIIGNYFNNNVIGDSFQSNNIGQDFYYNTIDPSFDSNTTTSNFNSNKIKTQISSVDFTDFYGNITGFTYSAPGSSANDGTYVGLTGATNGIGVNATFDIEVSGGTVVGVTGITQGKLYIISEELTILGSQIGGTDVDDDVVITVTGISQLPSVYEAYTCDIFERQDGTKRLSYYDSSDILTITNINE